jgi:hypothetical protein
VNLPQIRKNYACVSKVALNYARTSGTRQRSWLRHYATSRKFAVSIPDEAIVFFNLPNASSRTVVLGSTHSLKEMGVRNTPEGSKLPARKADLTAICEPIVQKMWQPRRIQNLWASTACYRDRFTTALYLSIDSRDNLMGPAHADSNRLYKQHSM